MSWKLMIALAAVVLLVAAFARQAAQATPKGVALRDLSQLTRGMAMYVGDWDDYYPWPSSNIGCFLTIQPYVATAAYCVAPRKGSHYVFNKYLGCVNDSALKDKEHTPMFYEDKAYSDGSHIVSNCRLSTVEVPSASWYKTLVALNKSYKRPRSAKPLIIESSWKAKFMNTWGQKILAGGK